MSAGPVPLRHTVLVLDVSPFSFDSRAWPRAAWQCLISSLRNSYFSCATVTRSDCVLAIYSRCQRESAHSMSVYSLNTHSLERQFLQVMYAVKNAEVTSALHMVELVT